MAFLKQSTSQSIRVGPFLDSTDGDTEETGLTIVNTDVRLSKDGGNFAAKNSGGLTHDENGWYSGTLDATDTNTLGMLDLYVHVSGALGVWRQYQVLPANIYDALVGDSDKLQVDAVEISSDATAANAVEANIANLDATISSRLASTAAPTNFSDLSITATTGRVDVASIEGTDATDQLQTAGETALETYGLDHLISVALPTGWGTDVIAGSVFDTIADDGTASFDRTTDSLQAIADSGGGGPTAAQIADAVWDEAQGDHTSAGSFGEIATEVAAILVDTAEIGTAGAGLTAIPWNSSWDAEVQSEVTDALNAYDPPTKTEMDSGFAALNDPTTAAIADAVWDEVITGAQHNVNNSAAKYLRESSESVGLTGTAQSATATTLVLASGAVPADDFFNGERVSIIEGTGAGQSRLIMDSVASTDTVTVAHAWTTNPDSSSVYSITGAEVDIRAVAEQTVAATASVDFDDLAAILVDTGTTIPGQITGLNDIAAADVWAVSLTEPTSPFAWSGDFGDAINWLAALSRNKFTQTSTTATLRNDADAANVATSTVSDDGSTFERSEWS